MRLGNAIAAESETARPESRRSRANYPARHTVRRLEPRTFLTALNSQERTPHGEGTAAAHWGSRRHHFTQLVQTFSAQAEVSTCARPFLGDIASLWKQSPRPIRRRLASVRRAPNDAIRSLDRTSCPERCSSRSKAR